MPRHHLLLSLLAASLCGTPSLAAQENASLIESPFRSEWAIGPSILGGGRHAPSSGALLLSAMYIGHERGLRLGLMLARADITDRVPSNPTQGIVRARNGAAIFVERLHIRRPGPWVIITGYGLGLGALGYEFDNTRNTAESQSPEIYSWAPALTASADIAWHFLYIGLRSSMMLGVQRVSGAVPSSGPVPSTRGIGHVQQLTIGVRFELFESLFR